MLNKIKKEYKRFIKKEFKKSIKASSWFEKNEHLEEIFDLATIAECQYGNEWNEFYLTNKDTIHHKLNLIKQGLDDESKSWIDLVFKRALQFYPFFNGMSIFYARKKDILTDYEIKRREKAYIPDSKIPLIGMNELEECVFRYHCGLKELPASALKRIEGSDFIDGGAFIGDSAFVFSNYKPNKIYAFEPCIKNYENLIQNIKTDKLENTVIPVKKGLYKNTGTIVGAGEGLGFFTDNEKTKYRKDKKDIEVISIDDFTFENNVNVGLIKLDVEGVETATIKGALETIKKYKPVLLISIYHNPTDFFEIKPLIENLGLGYNLKVKKLNNRRLVAETVLIAY